ncbi:YoaK family protein [Lentilactobacillus senioris]|uniref:YoaK family protein n=1 Tax=Lentilactobacillus senioris TaxID=931534 RepID=UPI0022822FAE|nr:YoaK family protein [Lentilactobacillus senioris]MCY9806067.1 YoaK family protein [Lentilactobacillus senioris]
MTKNTEIAEQPIFGSILTMVAGSIDAYTFILHGEVFAGLQTGNLILLGLNLGRGQFAVSLRYALSLLAFFVGTIFIRILQRSHWFSGADKRRRQMILLYEFSLLVLIAVFGEYLPNLLATSILSMAAAAELQEFRKLAGGPFTPLMMTGNLRTLAESSFDAVAYHETAAKNKLKTTALIMVTFALGASIMALLIPITGTWTILFPAFLLLVAWLLITTKD